ncbi:MAG: TonB-dependent receptor [Proteobacteria bacterium]|nr:TonB-dependent receptor [Desulfobulbaceae bacterium]MBU4152692.1 TonB-dependent receptor [Pseudomonadota bacterium]
MKIVGIIGAAALFAAPASAAEVTQQLDAISVTATRLERESAEVPASITVVGQDEIKDSKMFNLKDALTGTPGVLIDTKNQGYDSRLMIRGAGLKASYGIREIMVLLDGVPITDPDSFTRLDFIDTQLIDRIEVVKGPNSTLWGANAAGGVINIISKDPLKEQGGIAKVGFGTEDTENFHLSYNGAVGDKWFYSASGSRRESENSWRRRNEFDTTQFSLSPTMVLEDGASWSTRISYSDANLQLPSALNQQQYESYLQTGEAMEDDGPWQYSGRYSDSVFVSSKVNKEFGDFEIVPILFFNHWTHNHPVTGRINDSDTNSIGTDLQLNYKHTMFSREGVATGGVTVRFDDSDTDYFQYADYTTIFPTTRIAAVLSDRKGVLSEKNTRQTLLWGAYIQESLRPAEKWLVDVGVRYDKVDFDTEGTIWSEYDYAKGSYTAYNALGTNLSVEKTYEAISPRIGVSWEVAPDTNLFTNASTGIQTPTDSELTDNPDLSLVKVQSYELGLKAKRGILAIDTSVYFSPVTDEVVKVVGENNNTSYVNAGKTEKKGFEAAATFTLPRGFDLGANYSYTDYTFDEFSEPVRIGAKVIDVDRTGNTLPYIPTNQYSLSLGYHHACGFKAKVQSQSWGEYYMDNANTEKYAGYDFVTGLMLGFETGGWDFTVNVDNVFDDLYSVETTKDTAGKVLYRPAAPRSLMARVVYRF